MSLVTGYDSDSDDEAQRVVQTTLNRTATATVPLQKELSASNASSAPLTSKIASSSKIGGKRKADRLQIRVEDVHKGVEGVDEKKSRCVANLPGQALHSKGHGLFSILPPPSNTKPRAHAKDMKAEANSFGLSNDQSSGTLRILHDAETSLPQQKKAKGNADFRAMLGLGPSKQKEVGMKDQSDARSILESPATSNKDNSDETTHSFALPAKGHASIKDLGLISAAPAVAVETAIEQAGHVGHAEASEASEDAYRGWQQGPDGAWFPVTPEAHASYAAHLAAVSNAEAQQSKALARNGFDVNEAQQSQQTFDANAGLINAEQETNDTSMDKRYALAAASVASSGVRVDLSGLDQEEDRADKSKNMRARRKGQLSSLIAQADENKEKLEERWSRGRAARTEAQKRYGF